MKTTNDLPELLRPWAAQIETTNRSFIKIDASTDPIESPWQSRLGGRPYWPQNLEYPVGANEAPLHLLIQINFSETPSLPLLPEQGLLQIFIADDPLYGMDYQAPQWQSDFRVVYHQEVLEKLPDLIQDFSFLSKPEDFPMPWRKSYALKFSIAHGSAPADSPEFAAQLGNNFFKQFGNDQWNILADYRKYVHAEGHKMGGYAHFPQDDPRDEGQAPFLLLQLDSDTHTGLNWGDRGTAHFFIEETDLVNNDFSRLFYSWSSY